MRQIVQICPIRTPTKNQQISPPERLALIEQVWMPRPAQWFEKFDPIAADFTYVRWLGDRKGMEEQTKTWDKVILDRSGDLAEWVKVLKTVHKRQIQILAFANNHHAGHAPATVERFRSLWGAGASKEIQKKLAAGKHSPRYSTRGR